jgi:hypothetical protein
MALVEFDDSDEVGEDWIRLLSAFHAQEGRQEEGGGKHKLVEVRSYERL